MIIRIQIDPAQFAEIMANRGAEKEERISDSAGAVPSDKIQYYYRAAYIMANTLTPAKNYAELIISEWDAKNIPEYTAMARAWSSWVVQNCKSGAPMENTPDDN